MTTDNEYIEIDNDAPAIIQFQQAFAKALQFLGIRALGFGAVVLIIALGFALPVMSAYLVGMLVYTTLTPEWMGIAAGWIAGIITATAVVLLFVAVFWAATEVLGDDE